MRTKTHAVLLQSPRRASLAEGLRCAVGLTLAGDRVLVAASAAAAAEIAAALPDPAFARPIATLSALGHELVSLSAPPHDEFDTLSPDELRTRLLGADTCEAW